MAIVCLSVSAAGLRAEAPVDLRVEWQKDPVGVDVRAPRLSWRLETGREKAAQSAWEVQVASTAELLAAGKADLWASGKVVSDQSVLVPYAGKGLVTDHRVYWRVRTWDEADKGSDWSGPGSWVPGVLEAAREWKAQWVGLDKQPDDVPQGEDFFGTDAARWIAAAPNQPGSIYFLKTFDVKQGEARRVMIGLLCDYDCRISLNGVEILQSGNTAGVAPARYMDITPWVKDGRNVVTFWCAFNKGLRASVRIEKGDGGVEFIRTDKSWLTGHGTIDLWDVAKSEAAITEPARECDAKAAGFRERLEFGKTAVFQPAAYLRNEFQLRKPVESAILHAAALGLCDLFVNGTEVGAGDRFKPGWSQFDARRLYVSYDVTKELRVGKNAWGAILADGWYRGNNAWNGRCVFGDQARLAAQLTVRYTDGSEEVFTSGPEWQAAFSPYTMADIDCGEDYDPRAEQAGWSAPGYQAKGWSKVEVGAQAGHVLDVTRVLEEKAKAGNGVDFIVQNDLVGMDPYPGKRKMLTVEYKLKGRAATATALEGTQCAIAGEGGKVEIVKALYGYDASEVAPAVMTARATESVAVMSELKPVAITEPKPGVWVFDFGQNAAGWTRIKLTGQKAGDTVLVRYGEYLNPDGTISTINLRAISPHERYLCTGKDGETYEPRFTYHGYRFAQVVGLRAKPDESTLVSRAANSAGPITSTFETSSELINKIYRAITWSQRSNFFEVPTDCPQRDERLGWTGDFQFFGESASYNQEAASFYRKWMQTQIDAEVAEGPDKGGFDGTVPTANRSAGWPIDWNMSLVRTAWLSHWMYGDDAYVREHWRGLMDYMGYFEKTIDSGNYEKVLGDWLSSAPMPPKPVIFYAQAVEGYDLMGRLATDLGYAEEAAHFAKKAQEARDSFQAKCVKADGTIDGDTLTGYAMAIALNAAPEANRKAIADHLVRVFEKGNEGMYLGFAGASRIFPALTAIGRNDLAAKALLKKNYPSLGYMIESGATTTWETWGNRPPGSNAADPNNRSMSENHYTFASSGAWLFEHLVGISPGAAGFKVIHFEPQTVAELDYAKGSVLTPYGRVSAGWKRTGGELSYEVVIPANASGEVSMEVGEKAGLTVNGAAPKDAERGADGKLTFKLPAGNYTVKWRG